MRATGLVLRLLTALLAAAVTVASPRAEPAPGQDRGPARSTLTLAKVSNTPHKYLPALSALGRYLVSGLGDLGIAEARVILARDNGHMIDLLRAGEADLVTETLFSACIFVERAGAEFLAREWRGGMPVYHTVFFGRKEGPIRALGDLVGKTIAFEDPGSTSAYALPVSTLRRAGIPLFDASAPGSIRSHDAVNFVFAEDEINIVAWVARGRADAGVLSNLDWSDPAKAPPSLRRELRVFHETEPVTRALTLVRGDLDAPLKARLKELLLAMHETAEGRGALERLGVTKYDETTGRAPGEPETTTGFCNELR